MKRATPFHVLADIGFRSVDRAWDNLSPLEQWQAILEMGETAEAILTYSRARMAEVAAKLEEIEDRRNGSNVVSFDEFRPRGVDMSRARAPR